MNFDVIYTANNNPVNSISYEAELVNCKNSPRKSLTYYELSLYEFFKVAWPYIEWNMPYIGWHIKAIAQSI
jgi:hypothetical protein